MKPYSGETFTRDPATKTTTKFLVTCLVIFTLFFSYNLRFTSHYCFQKPILHHRENIPISAEKISEPQSPTEFEAPTNLRHIEFGIAGSARLWNRRKKYIKQWWRPNEMRGSVWLDRQVSPESSDRNLPPVRISGETSQFRYRNSEGHRSAIRLSRIVSEAVRTIMASDRDLGSVRWFVLGDDDTVFVAENLVRVLRKYDHREFYYIGSNSESHVQNIHFSYKMAYGGGGFAISASLAFELAKMQDRCLVRYSQLYGSDDRIHACMAELGVPLTTEPGFHQFDVYGSVFGLLAAHPVAPLVTLHHLDIIKPIFPNTDRVNAIKKLTIPMGLDSAALAQQSICYSPAHNWTISVSWGYAAQIFRGVILPREMEIPGRTFQNWYPKADDKAHAFNTRPYAKSKCQKPFVYYFSEGKPEPVGNRTLTRYGLNRESKSDCKWEMDDPSRVQVIEVYKTTDPNMWEKAPRRNCCRILPSIKKETLVLDVGVCLEGEFPQL